MTTTRIKFEFLVDAAMYYGSIRIGDTEIVFDKEAYNCSYVSGEGIFPFTYEDSFCRYVSMVYWDMMVDRLRNLIDALASQSKDFIYEIDDLKISFIGYEVYVDGELLRKPSGIPGIDIGMDVFDADFIFEKLYCGLGFGLLIDIVEKMREFSMEVQNEIDFV